MNKIILRLTFVMMVISIPLFGQVDCLIYKGEVINCSDASGLKIGRWLSFDSDSMVYSENHFDSTGFNYKSYYVLRDGQKLTNYKLSLDISCANHLKNIITSNFSYDNVQGCAKGIIWISFIIDPNNKVIEARLTRGIDSLYNAELMRCVNLALNTKVNIPAARDHYILCDVPIRL
jgi:hypothetical protein